MGKLVASTFVSLDNLTVAEGEDMSWVIDGFDPAMGADMGEVKLVRSKTYKSGAIGLTLQPN